jgi:nucleoside phosphorylase
MPKVAVPEPVSPNKTAVILTALEVETSAVLRQLGGHKVETVSGTGFFRGQFEDWTVLVAEVGPGNFGAAVIAMRALERYQPRVAMFVGVAGGVKDVTIGDVVVATKVYGYEAGKDSDDRFRPRPEVLKSAHDLEQRARILRQSGEWRKRLNSEINHQASRVLVGPIAAGEKVVASSGALTAKLLKELYSDVLAVEMEGRGFLEAVHINQPVRGCVVRGISDLLTGKADAEKLGSQERSSDAASAVAFEILAGADGGDDQPITKQGKRHTTRAWPFWNRWSLYAIGMSLLAACWIYLGVRSFSESAEIFRDRGMLRDQLVYRVLSYDPERHLIRRLTGASGETFVARYQTLDNFLNVVRFRPLPLQVVPTEDWTVPHPEKIVLKFDGDKWRFHPDATVGGPLILVRTVNVRYSGQLNELNDCMDAYRAGVRAPVHGDLGFRLEGTAGRSQREIALAPPFVSLGTLQPASACKLFLEAQPSSMTIAELNDRLQRIAEWKWTNFLKPYFAYYVAETTTGLVSSMNDHLWDSARYFDRSVFDALSIEDADCEKYGHCVAYEKTAVVGFGSDLRESLTLPRDTQLVRMDYIHDDDVYLVADISPGGSVKSLRAIFPIDLGRHMEMVRMAQPFRADEIERLNRIRNLPISITLEDSSLSYWGFGAKLWLERIRPTELPSWIIGILIVCEATFTLVRYMRSRDRADAA